MARLFEYAGNHVWLVGATLLVLVALIVNELRLRSNAFASLTAQDAIRLMNQNALVLDLRPVEQYREGHLAQARHMPSDQILKAGETLKKHKEKPVLVYCESGSLGASAARQLAEQGFTKAFNLRGGLGAWRADSLPLVKGGK